MKTPDQYREFAAECYRLAAEAKTEEHEKILREVARAWREMAEETEANPPPWSVQELSDDQLANAIKAKLDKELAGTDPNVGVRFELDLFKAFKDRGWITLESFGPLGNIFGATKLPTYGTHLAIATWDLPEDGYQVGHNPPKSARQSGG